METNRNSNIIKLKQNLKYRNILIDAFPLLGLIIIILFFTIITSGNLLTLNNLKIILNQMFLYLIGGLGSVYLYAQGGIDVSMASNIGFSAILGVRIMYQHVGIGIIATLLIGSSIGLLMGIIYAYAGIPVFIQGLAMDFLLKGTLYPLSGFKASIPVPDRLLKFDNKYFAWIFLLIIFIFIFFTYNFSRFGKECRSIGAGEIASIQSGIKVKKNKVLAFFISGLTCGIVAVYTLIRTGSASQSTGLGFNFNVMLSLVLGGCVLGGGNGVKVRNAVIGAVTFVVLQNGLVLCGASARAQDIVKGILFVLMIVFTSKMYERKV